MLLVKACVETHAHLRVVTGYFLNLVQKEMLYLILV